MSLQTFPHPVATTPPAHTSAEYLIHFLHRCGCHGNTKFPHLTDKQRSEEGAGKKAENSICKDTEKTAHTAPLCVYMLAPLQIKGCCATCMTFCTWPGISWGSADSVHTDSEVRRALNVQCPRHSDTDTEACWQLSAVATGVAAEMLQLLRGYFRLISMHNQALLFAAPLPTLYLPLCSLI